MAKQQAIQQLTNDETFNSPFSPSAQSSARPSEVGRRQVQSMPLGDQPLASPLPLPSPTLARHSSFATAQSSSSSLPPQLQLRGSAVIRGSEDADPTAVYVQELASLRGLVKVRRFTCQSH